MLALGHQPHELTPAEADLSRFADRHGLRYLAPGNPADVSLDDVSAGEPVLLRGMGLNFFDYLALFTLGRGGEFTREPGRRAGLRPVRPGTAAGRRVAARGPVPRPRPEPEGRVRPARAAVPHHGGDRAAAPAGRADFRRDVWPLIDQEVRTVFYAALVRERGCACDAEEFTEAFAAAGPAEVSADPLAMRETEAQRTCWPSSGSTGRWDWGSVATPYSAADLASTAAFRAWLRSYVDAELAEARKGNVTGPLKAATRRPARPAQRDPAGRRPRRHLRRLLPRRPAALVHAAQRLPVDRAARRTRRAVRRADGRGRARGARPGPADRVRRTGGSPRSRQPAPTSPSARHDADRGAPAGHRPAADDRPAAASLLARGECRPYHIPIRGGSHSRRAVSRSRAGRTGCWTPQDRPHPRRFAFGVPTETVHWVTAAGIRPGVNSVILGDADAIARACLCVRTPRR